MEIVGERHGDTNTLNSVEILYDTVGRPNFTPYRSVPYRTLAFFVYRFDRLASTVPYRFPLKTVKPLTEPFKTEFYTHILL